MAELFEPFARKLHEFNVSVVEKDKCFDGAIETITELFKQGKLTNKTGLIIRTSDCCIAITKEDGTFVYSYVFKGLQNPVVCNKDELERLIRTEKKFRKDIKKHPEDIGFFLHVQMNDYMNLEKDEFIVQLKSYKFSLTERKCKINSRKYILVTLINDQTGRTSKIEFALGRVIQGWSYLFIPEKWDEMKKEVMTLVD
jgi:hypothetical protein